MAQKNGRSMKMAKIKWKDMKTHLKEEAEEERKVNQAKRIDEVKIEVKTRLRGKPFKNLNGKDKDYLIESMAKILGLIEG